MGFLRGPGSEGARWPGGQVADDIRCTLQPCHAATLPPCAFSHLAWRVALSLFAVYLLSYRGGFHAIDEVSTFSVTESLVKFGQLNTDQIAWTQWVTTQAEAQGFFGVDHHVYSKKGFGISLAQVPLYWLALYIPFLGQLQTVSLLNAIITAWTAALLALIVKRLGFPERTAMLVALIYGLATIAWVYAKYLFSGPLAAFFLIWTLYLILVYRAHRGSGKAPSTSSRRERDLAPPFGGLGGLLFPLLLAGFCAGLAVLTRANNFFLLPIFGLYLIYQILVPWKVTLPKRGAKYPLWEARGAILCASWQPILAFMLGGLIAGGILAWYNWTRVGNPLQTGYDLTLFSSNVFLGFYKLLFSPLRGLFIYSPILILTVPSWFYFRKSHSAEAWLCLGLVGTTLLLFSAWSSGEGLSWGSRFLIPLIPFMVLTLTPFIQTYLTKFNKSSAVCWLMLILTFLSFAIQILGVIINPWVYLGQLQADFGGEFFLERTAALYDFSISQIRGQWQNMRLENSDLAWWQPWGFDGLAFGLSMSLVLLNVWYMAYGTWCVVRRRRSMVLAIGLVTLIITPVLISRYAHTDRQFGKPDDAYLLALQEIEQVCQPSHQIISIAPYSYHLPMNRFKAKVPWVGFAQQAESSSDNTELPETAVSLLQTLISQPNTQIWFITLGLPPADPSNRVEAWLAQHTFKAIDKWLPDGVRLVQYGVVQPTMTYASEVIFKEQIRLIEYSSLEQSQTGQVLPLRLVWQIEQPLERDYTIFVQLLTAAGTLAAQHDSPPQSGYYPTSQWLSGEAVSDQHGLFLPADLPAGDYQLILGLYDPATGQRLPTATNTDFITLGSISLENFHP